MGRNPTFMKANCMRSCNTCLPAKWEGEQATALVRDAWQREYIGIYTAQYDVKHLDPHEGRVLVIRFEEPGMKTHRTLEKLIEKERGEQDVERAKRASAPRAPQGCGKASEVEDNAEEES